MNEERRPVIIRFITLLAEGTTDLLGTRDIGGIVPGISVRRGFLGIGKDTVEASFNTDDEKGLKKTIADLIEVLSGGFGDAFAEDRLEDIYTKLEKDYSPSLVNQVVVPLIPPNFLEKYRLQYLSKEELEARVLEKTRELRQLNTELERKVADRTQDLQKLLEEQRQRDIELTKANAELRELDQRKSEFLSVAAHQLRTPLSGLKWALQMLIKGENGPLTKEQKVLLTKSYEGNERLIDLVDQMLHANQIEAGIFALQKAPTQILDLVDSVLYEVSHIAGGKNVRITFDRGGTALPPLMIDQTKMRAVFQNLLENAVKYSKPGGEVTITVSRTDKAVQFKVKDTGIGIPKDQQAQIFSRFFRARNAQMSDPNGNGLGLYIVRSIVEMHGGTLRFESGEDEGTAFYFGLPI
ncbi:MAG: HAMP domain-containing sensor histidine kinase [bacterium]|nr:HAMP domain-containing sensor histidine kinase [bacterium]